MNTRERSLWIFILLTCSMLVIPAYVCSVLASSSYFFHSMVTRSYSDRTQVNVTVLVDEGQVGTVRRIYLFTDVNLTDSVVLNAVGYEGSISRWETSLFMEPKTYFFTFMLSFVNGSVDIHEIGEVKLELEAVGQLPGFREVSFLLSLSLMLALSSVLLLRRLIEKRRQIIQPVYRLSTEEQELVATLAFSGDERC